MSMDQLLQQFGGGGGGGGAGAGANIPVADTAETIQISSMKLLLNFIYKSYMLKDFVLNPHFSFMEEEEDQNCLQI